VPWKRKGKESVMLVMIVSTGLWEPPTSLGRIGRSGWVGRVLAFLTTLPTSTLRTASNTY
jgi:hypothetical protein